MKQRRYPRRIKYSISFLSCMQSSVRCPWSLWNSQYFVLSLLAGFDLIWDGHLRNCSCCTSRKTCDTAAIRGVNRRGEYCCRRSGLGGPRRSLRLPHLFGDRSLSFFRDLSRSLCLLGSVPVACQSRFSLYGLKSFLSWI